MDISELLDTTREAKINESIKQIGSLFSTSIFQIKALQTTKVKLVKSRKPRKKRNKDQMPEESPKQSTKHETPPKQTKEETGNFEVKDIFASSSNTGQCPGSEQKIMIRSELAAEVCSSSSVCRGIPDVLMPATATSSHASRDSKPQVRLECFSPARCESATDLCTFEEDFFASPFNSLKSKKSPIEPEMIHLNNSKGKTLSFRVFKEDLFEHKSSLKLMDTLVADVTYDEDQSSDDCIVKDGLNKAKAFLAKNIKGIVRSSVRIQSAK